MRQLLWAGVCCEKYGGVEKRLNTTKKNNQLMEDVFGGRGRYFIQVLSLEIPHLQLRTFFCKSGDFYIAKNNKHRGNAMKEHSP